MSALAHSPGSAGVPPASSPSGSAPPLGARASSPASSPGSAGVPPASSQPSEWHSRGYLPHFDREGVTQSITFRLHDSIPKAKVERWKQDLGWRKGWAANTPEAVELRRRLDRYMDTGGGECHLSDPRIAGIVQRALHHFDGKRYRLLAWCIMPNHVHVLVETMPGYALAATVQTWKSYTAHEGNRCLGRQGDFWFPEYFDRRIRDAEHFRAVIEYVHLNPVVAGLCGRPEEWPWSSAAGRGLGEEDAGGDARAPRGGHGRQSVGKEDAGGDARAPRRGCLQEKDAGGDARAPRGGHGGQSVGKEDAGGDARAPRGEGL
jgi:REP element-mobilizing transposase RayT